MSILDQLDDTYQKALALLAAEHSVDFDAGEIILYEGNKGSSVYFIVQGMVNVYIGQGESRKHLWVLSQGDIFGEMALLDSLPRTASVEAETDVELLVLERDVFYNLIGKYPALAVKVIQLMGKRMRKMDAKFKVQSGYKKPLGQ